MYLYAVDALNILSKSPLCWQRKMWGIYKHYLFFVVGILKNLSSLWITFLRLFFWRKLFWRLVAPSGACRNCLRQLYFKLKGRGIGYSFQLAITAPLYSITGYCIATAQSWRRRKRRPRKARNACTFFWTIIDSR